MDEVINTENICKTYLLGETRIEAVRGISIKINKGELVAIMGPSGSGKSTLMHLLGCLDIPTKGQYFLDGKDVSKLSSDELAEIRNKKIGFVFQTFNLLPHLSLWENIMLPARYNPRGDLKESENRANELLEIVGLADRKKHLPSQLSGGENQRGAIVRALVNSPVIVLADEPTGNLDSQTGLEITTLLKEMNEKHGLTEIIVTHNPNIANFTRRKIKIKDGLVESDELNGGQ
ncbi:MAG: lipoprotein-releasing system ATP-binding protein LolD [Caldiserica bacterium CG02_land_8_20_14_3_00_36_38]|nr:MAG: lipoprotein-releasing system ATP-binding protein LolD [Caldiserica bacterium CG02_land_8_20_14_3_00_36_38]PIX29655.1 MAG: lipoprotein-releasing system ATP-binding protein LolD [Caldiserica bacterium CG_4_8_14_3_um_filter_35_18]